MAASTIGTIRCKGPVNGFAITGMAVYAINAAAVVAGVVCRRVHKLSCGPVCCQVTIVAFPGCDKMVVGSVAQVA